MNFIKQKIKQKMFGIRLIKVANTETKSNRFLKKVSIYTTPQGNLRSVDYIVSSEREALLEKKLKEQKGFKVEYFPVKNWHSNTKTYFLR